LSGTSTRGSREKPTSLYEEIAFDGEAPGAMLCAAIWTLKSLSPMSSP